MDNGLILKRICHFRIKRLLSIVGILTAVLTLLHLSAYPYGNYLSVFSHANLGLVYLTSDGKAVSNNSNLSFDDHQSDRDHALYDIGGIDTKFEIEERNLYHGSIFDRVRHVNFSKSEKIGNFSGTINISNGKECPGLDFDSIKQTRRLDANFAHGNDAKESGCSTREKVGKKNDAMLSDQKLSSEKSILSAATNVSFLHDIKIDMDAKLKFNDSNLFRDGSLFSTNSSILASTPALRKRGGKVIPITLMDAILLNNSSEVKLKKRRWSSARDREIQNAKFQIENTRIENITSEVHASLFRNYSLFKRSYELMENTLKVYIYREGEKPFFHLPHLRGIYASEGWFMKLMERNKQFAVKDPKRAHLFYLPFSSLKLRNGLHGPDIVSSIENHLKIYVDMISTKYRFWNRSNGADHFLVACHDWAPRATRKIFGSSIRILCNSNLARGFKIGKDVSLPVTYIKSSENPLKDLGGNPPLKRPILAFFAGEMHGYVRPILLQHWYNKEPDMKIFGPMPRDVEGKARYREFMKSSKYCISAKGYQVHTPRVVESIYYECVPVIIADNYVPPFFEVLNWEAFALFILEDDIPNLRNILLSVPEDRYIMMQHRLKLVQRYFLWHKIPEKYDLFHMILHSAWYNRVFQFPGNFR